MKLRSLLLITLLVIAFVSLVANYILWNRYSSLQTVKRTSNSAISFNSDETIHGDADIEGIPLTARGESQIADARKIAGLIDQNDYAQIALLLNDLALPKEMIQMYIYAQIDHDISVGKINQKGPYWKPVMVDPYQLTNNLIETNSYKRQQLRAIFGDDIETDAKFENLFKPYNNQLDFLSSNQQIALQNLKLERMSNIHAGNISGYNQTSELDSIKNLLGEEDFYEYQLRESATAKYLMQELNYFDYSEQEYRDLFKIRQQTETGGRIRDENALTEDDKVRDYLGEERYEEYQRAKQPAYQKIQTIVKNNNINETVALSAYQTLSESLVNITRLRQNTNLSIDERASQISLLISETTNRIEDQVGKSLADEMVNQVLFSPKITRNALSLHNAP